MPNVQIMCRKYELIYSILFSSLVEKSNEITVLNVIIYHDIQMTLEGESYHKSCFKCSHGGCILTTCSYAALDGVLYCKIHFGQLFMEKGSYTHMKKKDSQEVLPDVAAEEQPAAVEAPPQDGE
jgi:hypothetical protein